MDIKVCLMCHVMSDDIQKLQNTYLQGRRSQKVPRLALFRSAMDILISISELAYVCTLIMTQEYHLPPSIPTPGTSHRRLPATPSQAGLRACVYASLSGCVFLSPRGKHNAKLSPKHSKHNKTLRAKTETETAAAPSPT